MITFRIVTVTNNLESYPQHWEDTREFPDLVEELDNDIETFVIDPRDGGWWVASEFFGCTNISHFVVDSGEAPV